MLENIRGGVLHIHDEIVAQRTVDAADILVCLEAKTLAPHDMESWFIPFSDLTSTHPLQSGWRMTLQGKLIQAKTSVEYWRLVDAMGLSEEPENLSND